MDRTTSDSGGEVHSTECDWLQRIALQQDEAAFDLLYHAYKKPGYNLARGILGDGRQAEDAFQDGMLRIWQMAGSFKPEGSPRGWILQIIARTSLAQLRRAKKVKEVGVDKSVLGASTDGLDSPDALIQRELHFSLCRQLARLTPSDRSLLAMYYGGNLTQDEMAAKLGVPQRTLSDRIRKTLDELRKSLTSAGMAEVAPVALEEGLCRVIYTGEDPPARAQLSILQAIREASTLDEAELCNYHFSKRRRSEFALYLIAGMCLLIGTIMIFRSYGVENVATTESNAESSTSTTQVAKVAPLNRFWTFSTSEDHLRDLQVIMGEWRWVPKGGPNGDGCMETLTEYCAIALTVPVRELPLHGSFQVRPIWVSKPGDHESHASIGWSELSEFANIRNVGAPLKLHGSKWFDMDTIIGPDFISTWTKQRLNTLNYSRRKPKAMLTFVFRGRFQINHMKIGPYGSDTYALDFRKYFGAIQNIDPAKRKGVVRAHGLKSTIPSKPIEFEFR